MSIISKVIIEDTDKVGADDDLGVSAEEISGLFWQGYGSRRLGI